MQKKLAENIILILLFLSVSFNITYWAIAKYDVNTDMSAVSDAEFYIKMSQYDYQNVPYRYANRFLMPSVVSLVSKCLNIENLLSRHYEDVGRKMVQLNFGIVNILCLTGTALFFFYFCRDLNFSKAESIIGCFLFFTSFFVITYYTVPLIDSMGCFFVMACLYMIRKENLFWLSICFLFGVFTKESTFVVLLMILLNDRTIFSKKLLVCTPAIFTYIIFSKLGNASSGQNIFSIISNISLLRTYISVGISSINLYTLIEITQTFMFMWILLVYSLLKCNKPIFIKKQLWLLLLPFVVPFLVGTSTVGRIAFYLFPIVITLSLLALRDIFRFNEQNT